MSDNDDDYYMSRCIEMTGTKCNQKYLLNDAIKVEYFVYLKNIIFIRKSSKCSYIPKAISIVIVKKSVHEFLGSE